MTSRQVIAELRFTEGSILSLAQLDPRSEGSFAAGSRNQLLLGIGEPRPWGGFLSKGVGTGSRQMFQVGKTWGGLKDIGGTQGQGSFFEDIGKSRWFIGAGQPNVEGVDMGGITASTTLQVSIADAGVYSAAKTFSAGLPQSSVPTVAIVTSPGAGLVGLISNPISFKIARLRLTTGARSIASRTSAVISPTAKTVRVTFPLSASGQDYWRVFATQQGFGGVGLHYAVPFNGSLDIPEAVVAAGVVDGVARSLEFDFKDGDLVPELAYIDDYAPPAGTHAVRLENVMCVLGAFGDSSTAVTAANPGTVGAISLPNFYESYKPRFQVYFPEQVVAAMARPSDSYCYVGHRNCVTAIQYVGLRDGPAVAVVMVWPDIGIAKPHNWTQVQGLLYAYVAKSGPVRMLPDGTPDYKFAAPVAKAMKAWDPEATVVGWHPNTMSVVWSNGSEAFSWSLQNERWSTLCYFADASISGTALSCVTSQGELVMTVNNGGAHTAYSWDTGAATMPITSISPYRRAQLDGQSRTARVREVQLAFETDRVDASDPMIISCHRNQRQTFFRDGQVTNGSAVINSANSKFKASHASEGEMVCVFGPGIGAGGINYLLGRISGQTVTTLTIVDPVTGAPLLAQNTVSGLYALLGNQIVAYPISDLDSQWTEFLDEFMVLDAHSYAIGINLVTNAGYGHIDDVIIRGNLHAGRWTKTT